MKPQIKQPKISFQISEEKKKILETFAYNQGLTLASFCRYVILKKLKGEQTK